MCAFVTQNGHRWPLTAIHGQWRSSVCPTDWHSKHTFHHFPLISVVGVRKFVKMKCTRRKVSLSKNLFLNTKQGRIRALHKIEVTPCRVGRSRSAAPQQMQPSKAVSHWKYFGQAVGEENCMPLIFHVCVALIFCLLLNERPGLRCDFAVQ